jgi:hypothetical protein
MTDGDTLEPPVYDWDHAKIGDAAAPVVAVIRAEDVRRYAAALDDRNPAYAADGAVGDLKVPPFMIRLYAPLRRRELVAEHGARYLDHSTPAVRWTCTWFAEPKIGDKITSITRVKDKYVRKGRRYLEWEVEARSQSGALVLRFTYVNLWERGRPEDRQR